jgi:hypothetical protein
MTKIRNYFIILASVFAISSACALVGVQDVNADDLAMSNLIKRIEALEAQPGGGGNVVAPKIRGMKIGFEIRHRFEQRTRAANTGIVGQTQSRASHNGYLLTEPSNLSSGVHQGKSKQGIIEDNEFTLQRMRLYFDADVNKNVRGFVKLQDTRVFGEEQSPTGNLARVDLLEAYVDLKNLGDLNPLLKNVSMRIGRWQWHYGDHRLIGTLNWANQSRAFDGARVKWDNKKGDWVDVFASSVQEDFTGGVSGTSVSSTSNRDEVFYGVYTHFKHDWAGGLVTEPYFIARSRSRDTNDTTYTPGEKRYTFGARVVGKDFNWLPGLDFKVEHAWQVGDYEVAPGAFVGDFAGSVAGTNSAGRSNSSESIQAYAGAAQIGYTFKNVMWTPRIGYGYVYASGDQRPGSGASKTFDQLYPTQHAHLGYIDFHAWQNIKDHQFHLTIKPTKKLLVKADLHFFAADQTQDNWYNVGGGLTRLGGTAVTGGGGVAKDIDDDYGQEIDITLKYKLFKNFGIVSGYSHYFVDDFIEDTNRGLDRDTDWFYLQTTMKF